VEHALFLLNAADVPRVWTGPFDRIYLGAEACHWLLPTPAQVEGAVRFCAAHGFPFTLVTPALAEAGLSRARALLEALPAGTEVVVNDWGLLRDVRRRGLVPVLGRLLVKVKRDPRLTATDLRDPAFARYLRSSNLATPSFQELLAAEGVARAELDNVPQGFSLELPARLHTSLHYPYVHASTTWRCAEVVAHAGARLDGSCRAGCGALLTRAAMPPVEPGVGRPCADQLFTQGGRLFFKNERVPDETTGWNLDRLVFMLRPDRGGTEEPRPFPTWDSLYQRLGAAVEWGYDVPDARLLALVERYRAGPSPTTLDLGCGNGRNGIALRAAGYRVVGLDWAPSALRSHAARSPAAALVRGDAARLPFAPAAFDLVVDSGCLHALPPSGRAGYADGVCRALRPGGRLVVVLRRRSPDRPPAAPVFFCDGVVPEWGFTPDEVAALFGSAMRLEESLAHDGRGEEQFWYLVLARVPAG
jgi:SAM-dependent methyltransferase